MLMVVYLFKTKYSLVTKQAILNKNQTFNNKNVRSVISKIKKTPEIHFS